MEDKSRMTLKKHGDEVKRAAKFFFLQLFQIHKYSWSKAKLLEQCSEYLEQLTTHTHRFSATKEDENGFANRNTLWQQCRQWSAETCAPCPFYLKMCNATLCMGSCSSVVVLLKSAVFQRKSIY